MRWAQILRRKPLEVLLAEMAGEHRLHRVLGPLSLTSLGVGAIMGAGIFALTGRMAFLPIDTWLRLVIWLALGLAIYLGYGYRHSRLGHELQREEQPQGLAPTDAPLTE